MNIVYDNLFKKLIPIVISILFAYILMSVLYFILPKNAPENKIMKSNNLEYKRFDINSAFKEKKIREVQKTTVQKKQSYALLKNIELIAIYAISDKSGYIIIKENNKKNTVILSSGDKFKQYTLNEIYPSYVVFTNASKEYKLSINEKKDLKYQVTSVQNNIKTVKDIEVDDDHVSIKRTLINDYIKNIDKIWKDVAIGEVRTKNGIDGFKVNRIRKNSDFAKIGIKKGDIIKSINNVELKSYNDAFKIYKKINTIKNLNIKLLRNNIEMEIFYEIK